jgi:hypothetical protein
MRYSNIHGDDANTAELFLEMFWVFVFIAVFTLILGVGIIWSSEVYFYEKIISVGVSAKDLQIDWDSASKGRAGRPEYNPSYYTIKLRYKDDDGREYSDYASMSVANYQLLSASFDHVHRDPGDDLKLLYMPDDPTETWLYPYEEADYPQFYGGWVVVVVSIVFVLLGPIAKRIVKSRYRSEDYAR